MLCKPKKLKDKTKSKSSKKVKRITSAFIGFLVVGTIVPLANIPLYKRYISKINTEKNLKDISKNERLIKAAKEKIRKENPQAIIQDIVQDFHPNTNDSDQAKKLVNTIYDNYQFKIVDKLKKSGIDYQNWETFNKYVYDHLDHDIFEDILNSFVGFYATYHNSWINELTERILLYKYKKVGIQNGYFRQYHTETSNAYFLDKNNFNFRFTTKSDLIAVHKLFGDVTTKVGFSINVNPNSKIVIDQDSKGVVLTNTSIFLESSAGVLSPYVSILVRTDSDYWKNWYGYTGNAVKWEEQKQIKGLPLTSILYSIINDKDNEKGYISKYFYKWMVQILINFFNNGYLDQQNIRNKKGH
ncbi:hypothetical protein [Mycoplasma bradburyae]|uniref:hypothetical protein n=1 Tax=Mycoplasma bradburyae TaxID=2963128 RepID=UPI0023403700|nr:hypothetical protein [Mycoplasma bradburyae]MDC4184177.1 hypothetical protein [Mycoplasma bradburyae]